MKKPYDPAEHGWVDEDGQLIDEEDRGLRYDLPRLTRRRMFGLAGGLGAAATLAACSAQSAASPSATTSATASGTASASGSATAESLSEIPDETAGPYPADGSSGMGGDGRPGGAPTTGSATVDVLDDDGIVRSDIRSSFGSASATAMGIPLTIKLTLKDVDTSSALVGRAVYLWQCNRDGEYSLYSQAITGENYLRGVQATDSTGTATFSSIFPACYSGRWPHIHFEVYESLEAATSDGAILKTSQIAMPKAPCDAVYATSGYEKSVTNLAQVTLASDNVFGDDAGASQLATMSGDVTTGYTAALTAGL